MLTVAKLILALSIVIYVGSALVAAGSWLLLGADAIEALGVNGYVFLGHYITFPIFLSALCLERLLHFMGIYTVFEGDETAMLPFVCLLALSFEGAIIYHANIELTAGEAAGNLLYYLLPWVALFLAWLPRFWDKE